MEENKQENTPTLHHPLASVARLGDKLIINGRQYSIIANEKDAVDLELLRQKYDPYLDQYDFLVGDISSEHLRLKGFFQDWVRTSIDKKVSTIVDYLTEYCNPGSGYFILQLDEDNTYNEVSQNFKQKKTYNVRFRSKNNYQKKKNNSHYFRERKVKKTKFNSKKDYAQTKKGKHHVFVIKKRKDR